MWPRLRLCVLYGLLGNLASTPICRGEPLRYLLTDGQKFSYEVEIQVDSPSAKTSYKGLIHYTVNNGGSNQSDLSYRGGLKESKELKQSARGSSPGGFPGRFPRGFPGPPPMPSPFSRPTFAGKSQTTNKLTISSTGQTLAMTGDSQLPYLLGNLSMIPFETLPQDEQQQWSSDSGISITEESDSRRDRFSPSGRFGPFGLNNQSNRQAGGEKSSYRITGRRENLVNVSKTYKLFTPETNGQSKFEMSGNGTWTFDRVKHIPQACNMKYTLTVTSDSTTTKIPISLKYERISGLKLAAMEAETKRKAEEAARKKAEAKAAAEAPLTPVEKDIAMEELGSGDVVRVYETLKILAEKSLENPDPQITAEIKRYLNSSDKKVAAEAEKAMMKWSPGYATKKTLAKAYQGPSPVKSTGLAVESITPLYVGQLVQAQRPRRGSFWRAARIKALLPDGTVKLAFLTWGKENDRDVVIVPRRSIQLAPPELEQPARRGSTATATTGLRTWSDATGRFKVQAQFINVSDGKVNLRRSDGRTMSIVIDKLSQQDQAYVDQLGQSENPFQLN